jgi:hypothetical protein
MASKKSSGKPWGSKSSFVRSLPKTLSAKEVVKSASEQGMKLSVAQVYNIRSTAKLKNRARGKTPSVGAAPARRTAPGGGHAEAQLRKHVAEVRLSSARQILAEVSAAFSG